MQAKVAGRKLIMVFLDSAGKLSRIADAERVRHWVESNPSVLNRSAPVASLTADPRVRSQLSAAAVAQRLRNLLGRRFERGHPGVVHAP